MPSLKHLGFFPWCPFKDKQDIKDNLFNLPMPEWLYVFNINIFEGLPVGLAEAMRLYWVVKKWKATGAMGVIGVSGQVITVNYECFYERDCSNELDLICHPKPLVPDRSVTYSHPDQGGLTMASNEFQIHPIFEENRSGTYDGGNIFNVWQRVDFDPDPESDLTTGQPINSQLSLNLEFEPEGNISNPYTLTAFGITYSVPARSSSLIPLSHSLSIEAVEYWPYDPEDGGGPVYNTSTGAVIRPDFFDR